MTNHRLYPAVVTATGSGIRRRLSTNPGLLASLQLALKHPQVVHKLLDAGAGRRRELLGGGIIHRCAVPPSVSARRDNERASRTSALIALADPGSGLSLSLTAIQPILRCTTTDSRPIEPRHQRRKWIP